MIKNIIDELSENNSRLFKESVLTREKNNGLLKSVFKAAYDPTINYYQKKIPKYSKQSKPTISLNEAIGQNGLISLSSRSVTGNSAKVHLENILASLSEDDASVLELIIKRDLKCGVSTSTINNVWPDLIPTFPYQRCSLPKHVDLDSWDWDNGIYSQCKADGLYAALSLKDSIISIRSRNGSIFPLEEFGDIVSFAKTHLLDSTETHGEMVVYKDGKQLPREVSNGLMNSVQQGGRLEYGEIKFLIWDQIPLEYAVPEGHYKKKYSERIVPLESLPNNPESPIQLIETKIVKSIKEAMAHYLELISNGFEGTIIKTKTGFWRDSTSKEQVKLKVECNIELKAISLNPGNGKNEDLFGSIYCESTDGLFSVNVPGYKDAERKEIFENWAADYEGNVLTVTINNIMPPSGKKTTYSSFLPRFVEWRNDKTEADTLQRIIDQYESVIRGKTNTN